ncbi:MAG: T9SS type A sorting domain-containing protein, partial [Bacteroidia bacterium]
LIHDFFTGAVINTITGLNFGPGNFGGEEAEAVDSLYIFTWDATIKTVSKYDMSGTLMQTLLLDSGENGHSISRAGNYLFVAHDGNYATGTWYGYLVDSVMSVSAINMCFGDTTFFTLSGTTNLLGAQWDFGDPASGVNNVSYNPNTFHTFTQSGTYTVQVIRFFTTYTDTAMLNITINSVPGINLGIDTVFCAGDSIQLNAGGGFTSYTWQDASTDSTYTATVAGTYYVTVSNSGCIGTDTINLAVNLCSALVANFYSSDTSFCEKLCIDFTDVSTNSPTSWQWFFPGSDSLASTQQNPVNICYNNYGSYDVTLIACNVAGCDTLVLTNFINEYQSPVNFIYQSNDTLYSLPFYSYQWYEVTNGLIAGATNQNYVPTQAGNYYCSISDSIGCIAASNTIVITGLNHPDVSGGQWAIVPNPVTDKLNVTINNNQLSEIILYDITSRKILQQKFTTSTTLNTSQLAKGIYIYELRDKGGVVKKGKVVKE